jgi:hypothetical protein
MQRIRMEDVLVVVGRQLAVDTYNGQERCKGRVGCELKYLDVRKMKFIRDIIFDDRILVALCVGTAILGLVALILLG